VTSAAHLEDLFGAFSAPAFLLPKPHSGGKLVGQRRAERG